MENEPSGNTKSTLLDEWYLFWESLKKGNSHLETGFGVRPLDVMSPQQIKELIRVLSQDRRRLNQKIEEVHKDIESITENMETSASLSMNQQIEEPTMLLKMNELNDQGQKLSHELAALDERLSLARSLERELSGN